MTHVTPARSEADLDADEVEIDAELGHSAMHSLDHIFALGSAYLLAGDALLKAFVANPDLNHEPLHALQSEHHAAGVRLLAACRDAYDCRAEGHGCANPFLHMTKDAFVADERRFSDVADRVSLMLIALRAADPARGNTALSVQHLTAQERTE